MNAESLGQSAGPDELVTISKAGYHQAFGLLAQSLLLSATTDKSSLLRLVITTLRTR